MAGNSVKVFNQTVAADGYRSHSTFNVFISSDTRKYLSVVNYVILGGIISVFGCLTNVINLIIFYRQGLDTTINISFFAMAISDLCSLIMQQCFNVFVNPWFEDLGVPSVNSGIQFIVAGVPRECFARITCLITVYITAERCLCITFPLRVKQIITPRRTIVCMNVIYILTFMSVVPLYCTTYIDWKFLPEGNTTIIGLSFTASSNKVEGVVMVIHAVVGVLSFVAVVVLTSTLIIQLRRKSSWRHTVSGDQEKAESMSNRDRKTIQIVVLIATMVIICYTPSELLFLTTFVEPEFSVGGQYSNLYTGCWSFALMFECINSSVNIVLYYSLSTKYRDKFHELISQMGQRITGR